MAGNKKRNQNQMDFEPEINPEEQGVQPGFYEELEREREEANKKQTDTGSDLEESL